MHIFLTEEQPLPWAIAAIIIVYCGQISTAQHLRIKVATHVAEVGLPPADSRDALITRGGGESWFSSNGNKWWGHVEWSRGCILSGEDNISITDLR